GKSDQLVVGILGVLASQPCQPQDRVAMDPDQPCGLTDAVALGQVVEDREGLLGREFGAEEGRALVLGESGLARVAVEQPEMLVFAEEATDREVAGVPSPVEVTAGVLAAEASEVVRGHEASWGGEGGATYGCKAPG